MNEIIDKIKLEFSKANTLVRLILINVAVFVLMILINLFFRLFQVDFDYVSLFALPADGLSLLTKPWTIITYVVFP